MTRLARIAGALALCATIPLSSCAGKRISDLETQATPSATSGATWKIPGGVVVTAAQRGSTNIDGLYPSTVPNDRQCCWLANLASIVVQPPDDASTVTLEVLVPDYPFFEAHPQTLTVLAGSHTATYPDLRPGVHRLTFAELPSAAAHLGEALHMDFVTKYTFVPAHEHFNADTRSLGIILLELRFEQR